MGWQLTEEAPVGTQIMSNVSVMLMRGRTDKASSVGSTPASAKCRVQTYACTVEVRPRLVATGGGAATFPRRSSHPMAAENACAVTLNEVYM